MSAPINLDPGGNPVDIAGFDITWAKPEDRMFINELVGIEAVAIDNTQEGPSWKFRPYPLSHLGSILHAIQPTPRTSYLEVGCGVGAKLVMVEKLFGLEVNGFDVFPEYVLQADQLVRARGCYANVWEANAVDYGYYRDFDVVFYNRVLWPFDDEYQLELFIQDQMRPGTTLILANGLTQPSWPVLTRAIAATVYRKPD